MARGRNRAAGTDYRLLMPMARLTGTTYRLLMPMAGLTGMMVSVCSLRLTNMVSVRSMVLTGMVSVVARALGICHGKGCNQRNEEEILHLF